MMGSDLASSRLRSRLLLAGEGMLLAGMALTNRNVEGLHRVVCSNCIFLDTLPLHIDLD